MKIFFLALILGIFLGLFVGNYFSGPEAFESIKASKTRLLNPPEQIAPAPPVPQPEIKADESLHTEMESAEIAPENPVTNDDSDQLPEQAPDTIAPKSTPNRSSDVEPEQPAEEFEVQEAEPKPDPAPPPEESAEDPAEEDDIPETEDPPEEVVEPNIEVDLDVTIAESLRTQFELLEDLPIDSISISVEDQIVTLSGQVATEEVKQQLVEIAVASPEVKGVEDQLAIAP